MAHFETSLGQAAPPGGLSPAVAALWWLRKGDWNKAHDIVQNRDGDPSCDWVHALLHRMEGDEFNARYWYRRANRPATNIAVSTEAKAILADLLRSSKGAKT